MKHGPSSSRPAIHLVLFVMTFLSMMLVRGLWYAAPLIGILLLHEMGHFLMCRRHRVRATLPFFIPFPLPPLGTLGAVIAMRSPIPNKKALFDIGMAGPLLGYLAIVPVTIVGISMSSVVPAAPVQTAAAGQLMELHEPLMFHLLYWILGIHVQDGFTLQLHELAFAGWVGSLVTGLNLLPVGQLDGGHIVYAMFGKRSRPVFLATLLGLTAVVLFLWAGWVLFVILLFLFIRRHPPVMWEGQPLGKARFALGCLMLGLFVVSFVPAPFPEVGSLIEVGTQAAITLAHLIGDVVGQLAREMAQWWLLSR